jgi:TetR/AcrR family transcriptional regulator
VKLTNRLVNVAAAGRRARSRPAGDASRQRLCAAAAREFAAYGFAGASVDRIAAAARLNKAMIYYYFRSKAALYREVLQDMFRAVGGRVHEVAQSGAAPEEKIRGFVEAIAAEAEAHPHFPPIWCRELAEGGRHLDASVLRDIAGVVQALRRILNEGSRAGRFRPVNPLIVHANVVAPLLLFFASAPLRKRLEAGGIHGAAQISRDQVVAHVQRVTLVLLEGRM